MRLSDEAKAHIRRRATPGDVEAIRSLAGSEDPAVREIFAAMHEAVDGFDAGLEALGPALALLHDEEACAGVLGALEAEVPAVREILCGYAMLDLPERTRALMAAWNRGQEAVGQFLVNEVAAAMVAGMIVERARRREHAVA